MRIIFVPGIKTWNFYLRNWKKELPEKFPRDEIIFLDQIFYFHFEHKKIEKIVENGVKIISDGRPTKIIAHSFGGILAKTMIARAKNCRIEKLLTMASPHKMKIFGVRQAKNFLRTPEKISAPTFTFGGFFDTVVPFFWTKTENSIHQNFWSGHLQFLLSQRIRKKILNEI